MFVLYDVVIVGAGLSGLYAAYILSNHPSKLKICIVEARKRTGGRVETMIHTGVDIGAQWIGPMHTEMISLLDKLSLEKQDQVYQTNNVNQKLVEKIGFHTFPYLEKTNKAIRAYIQLIWEISTTINVECPWNHPEAKIWDRISIHDHICTHVSSLEAQDELLLFVQTVLACVPSETSFLFFLFYIQSGGGMDALGDGPFGAQKWKVKGGMSMLTTTLSIMLQNRGLKLFTSQHVKYIKEYEKGEYYLFTKEERFVVKGKKIIFALSPALVQKFQFYPPLPIEKQLGCECIVAGHVIKFVVSFPTAFWLSSTVNNNLIIGPVDNFFHGCIKKDPALIGFITGEKAIAMERLSVEGRQHYVLHQIKEMYLVDTPFIHYVECVWNKEEYSGGCFAGLYPPNGSFSTYGPTLRPPYKGFHWASTETATRFYGYMEGALLAGKRAANEILYF